MAGVFNPRIYEVNEEDSGLVYIVSFRTIKAIKLGPVSKQTSKQNNLLIRLLFI